MNREETIQIMSVLKAAYPKFYDGMSRRELEGIVSLWQSMFDDPYPVVAAAVKALIVSESSGFPPVIGKVKEKIRQLKNPDEMTELEAWGYVAKALRNSTYNSGEEYEKLPPVVKRLVGSPAQLKEWAAMDSETVQSVVASNFQRSYKVRAKSEREYLALPEDVKQFVGQLAEKSKMPELPEQNEEKALQEKQDKIKRLKSAFELQDAIEEAVKESFVPVKEVDDRPDEQKVAEFEERRKKFLEQLKEKA